MAIKTPIIHPVLFEGVRLPDFAGFLDFAATMTPVSEETAMWFWRFSVCVGAPRKERSKIVQTHAKELLAGLASSASGMMPELVQKFPGYHPEQVFSDWVKSLRMILEISQSRRMCQWHMQEAREVLYTEASAWGTLASTTSATA